MNGEHDALSPLQLAALEGNLSDVQWLVEMGEDVDEVDYQGRTSLSIASQHNHNYVSLFLITVGVDVNIADFNGITPLHHCASYSLVLVESLVAHGAMISNPGGPLGLTPLHIAAHSRQLDIVRFLLKRGADMTIRTTKGDLPIDMTDDESITKTIHKADLIRKKMNRNEHAERFLYGGLDENTKPTSSQSSPPSPSTSDHRDQSRPMITFEPTVTVWRYDPTTEPDCSLVATETINLKKRKWYQTFSADNKN